MAAIPEEAMSGMRRYEVKVAQDIMGDGEGGGGGGGCGMCCSRFAVMVSRCVWLDQVV